MNGYSWRDKIVCVVCNWLLNHVASERYRKMIGGSIWLGMETAMRKERDAR